MVALNQNPGVKKQIFEKHFMQSYEKPPSSAAMLLQFRVLLCGSQTQFQMDNSHLNQTQIDPNQQDHQIFFTSQTKILRLKHKNPETTDQTTL